MSENDCIDPETDPPQEPVILSTTNKLLLQDVTAIVILLVRLLSWILYPTNILLIVVIDLCLATIWASFHHLPLRESAELGALIGFVHGLLGRWLAHLIRTHLPSSS